MKRDAFTLPLAFPGELIIDNFAGGGGTSTGLEAAFGRPVDIAINHNAEALAMHAANHPHTRHLCESVWDVDPIEVTQNQPVGLVWLSPDCKHFSKAKGGKPVEKEIRGLAWIGVRWVIRTKPRGFMLENVEEFQTWGPLLVDEAGNARPDPAKKGQTFRVFKQMLTTGVPLSEREGSESIEDARAALCTGPLALTEDEFARLLDGMHYSVECAELKACDYGTPTIRKRFFMVGRRDGLPTIARPPVTHAAPGSELARSGNLKPWRTAAECIDWSIPCPSIFERTRPLADATLRRIAKGIMRYVVNAERPFIVPLTHQGGDRVESIEEPTATVTAKYDTALVAAHLVHMGHGEGKDGTKRFSHGVREVGVPLNTVAASGMPAAIVTSHLMVNTTGHSGAGADDPLHTVTTGGHHAEVRAFLLSYYSTDQDPKIGGPLPTATTKDRFGLVTIRGQDYQIVDIGLRMLTPRELFKAQGFPDTYVIGDDESQGLKLTKSAQVRMCGNSVCPPLAEALARANFAHEAQIYGMASA